MNTTKNQKKIFFRSAITAFFFFLFSFFSSNFVYSSPHSMILAGEPILDDIRLLSLETGKPFLSFTPPLAPGEIKNFISSIDQSVLSQPAMEAYQRIEERLSVQAPSLSVSMEHFNAHFNFNAALEGRLRMNSDDSWNRHYPEVATALSLPINLYFTNIIQFYVEPALIMRPGKYGSSNFEHNIPLEYHDLDEQVPLRVFAAAGKDWWNIQLGRDRIVWGTGNTGSLSFSNTEAYYNFAQLSLFAKKFKYTMVINQMPLEINDNMLRFPAGFDPNDPIDPVDYLTSTTHRYFYMHRIDFSIKDKISIGIMEGVMVGNSALELRLINPFLIFHSLYSWRDYDPWMDKDSRHPDLKKSDMIGSFMSLEVNWNFYKAFSFYGQFVMNEFATWDESRQNSDQPPNALGYMAGLQYSHSFINWGSFYFLEFIFTDPYLYVLSSPFASILQMHRYGGFEYIGYPRDTVALTIGTDFFNNQDTLKFSGSLAWLSKGENDLIWNWEQTNKSSRADTPTGTVETKFIASLSARWKVLPYLHLSTNITGILSFNNNHEQGSNETGGQVSFGVSYHY